MANEAVYSRLLTDRAVGLMQSVDDYVATRAFHVVPQSSRTSTFFKFKAEDLMRCEFGFVAPGSNYPKGFIDLETVSVLMEKHGLDIPIPDEMKAEISNYLQSTADNVMLQGYRSIEREMVTKAFATSGGFSTVLSGSGNTDFTAWSTAATGSPFGDIRAAIRAFKTRNGVSPDSILMTEDVEARIIEHDDFKDISPGSSLINPKIQDLVALLPGIKNIYVTNGVENTNNRGNATQTAAVQASGKLLVYLKGISATADAAAAAKLFYFKNPEIKGGNIINIYTLRDEMTESDIVRGKSFASLNIQSATCGTLMTSCLG